MGLKNVECIIWDCDGCLIDSELLACSVSASLMGEFGYDITAQEYIERFAGKGIKHSISIIEKETNKEILPYFPFERLKTERKKIFSESLKEIDGVSEVLSKIDLPMCVASGSSIDRLDLTLGIVELKSRFEGRIYSSEQVENGKPAPDIFLYAARNMGVAPENCLVIEDSVSGIKAAKAAGMPVFAFLGASHAVGDWESRVRKEDPDLIFRDMRLLPELLKDAELNGYAT
jgi:HAD superfamily hydrolase (TIGR01509 family)